MVRDGGAVVQVGTDEALAASDVVDTADRRVSSVRQRETRLLFYDGADPLVTQVSVQYVLSCSGGKEGTIRKKFCYTVIQHFYLNKELRIGEESVTTSMNSIWK